MRSRDVSLSAGLKYRGGGPMWAWLLHRIGGVAMIVFISTHVIAGFFMQQMASDAATTINTIYESVYFQVVLYFFVIFHVLNGLRIILLDTWPRMLEYQREAIWLQWVIFLPVYGLAIFIMITRAIQGG